MGAIERLVGDWWGQLTPQQRAAAAPPPPRECANPPALGPPSELNTAQFLGYERPVIFVNGKFPSPTIEGEVGDRVIIEFVNLLGEPASVHWHGIRQAREWAVADWARRRCGALKRIPFLFRTSSAFLPSQAPS